MFRDKSPCDLRRARGEADDVQTANGTQLPYTKIIRTLEIETLFSIENKYKELTEDFGK